MSDTGASQSGNRWVDACVGVCVCMGVGVGVGVGVGGCFLISIDCFS